MKIFIGAHSDLASTLRNKFRKSLISIIYLFKIFFIYHVIGNINISKIGFSLENYIKNTDSFLD